MWLPDPLSSDIEATPERRRRTRLRAVPVWAWTVDEPHDMRRAIDLGVDAIYTNHPRRLLEVLSRAGNPDS